MAERTQTETAYGELRRRILILELRPGERMKEEQWAGRLAVSRSAIREALTRLLGEGLVQAGERGGYFIPEITDQDIREIRELREVLETGAFRLACARATSRQIRAIEETCDDLASLVRKGYQSGACECDLRFHELLVASAGNARLLQAYSRSNIPLFHTRLSRSWMYKDDFPKTESEHREILDALRRRDAEQGAELLRAHFSRGETGMLGQ